MNWITTNIRLPEDLYMQLKIQAARERTSVAAIIRERMLKKPVSDATDQASLLNAFDTFATVMAKKGKRVNLTKAVIDARYEP